MIGNVGQGWFKLPSLRTCISDLYHNRSKRVLGWPEMHRRSESYQDPTLSDAEYVKEFSHPIWLNMEDGPNFDIDMVPADRDTANGMCLFYSEGWSTVATLTRSHRIAVGGGYSGCLYSVYDAGGGVYKCVHTARPGDARPERYVVGLQRYALDHNWNLVHAVPTVGLNGHNGCTGIIIVTRISYNQPTPVVRTVRLERDPALSNIRRTRWET
jgi:hypothetical protein